jgi:hypothetical protein
MRLSSGTAMRKCSEAMCLGQVEGCYSAAGCRDLRSWVAADERELSQRPDSWKAEHLVSTQFLALPKYWHCGVQLGNRALLR